MADQFQDPRDQASLNELEARLRALNADAAEVAKQIEREATAVREQQRAGQAGARGGRTGATALPSLEKEVEAVKAQEVSYENLNRLIARRIQLERDAASAATATAKATAAQTAPAAVAAPAAAQKAAPASVLAVAGSGGPAKMAAEEKAAATSAKALAMSELEVRAAVEQAAIAMVKYDDTLSKTGGLSGAALKALGDGTLTLRDLGNQAVTTISKFAGWAVAGSAVFGMIGALDELKKGAVDTSSAVTGLTRFLPSGQAATDQHLPSFNPDQARDQLIEQARGTATPIKEVGDAAQQFAKVFKDQNSVFTATHVALQASKLDNISLADSYRYLTAIVQETGHNANYLPQVFDQITAAQDRLGAKMSQLMPAFAGSIGAVQTAGGNPDQLLGLESLTLVRTGRSGSQVATGYARGATNFFPTAASRGTIERINQEHGLGINLNEGFTAALIESIKGASSKGISETEKRQLSTAFFGPLRGSMFTNLFNTDPKDLDKFLKQTTPGESKGLANQQLSTAMSQANNQLALLKINLQAIGAELSGSKMTTPFSALLTVLNTVLRATGDLIHAWNQLPGTVKEIGADAAVAFGVIGLGRRFNVGGALAQRDGRVSQALAPIFSRNPEKVLNTQVGQYMEAMQGGINADLRSTSLSLGKATRQLTLARDEMAALEQEGKAGTEAYTLAQKRAAAATDAVAAAQSDMAGLSKMGSAESLAAYRASLLAAGRGGGAAGGGEGGIPFIPPVGVGEMKKGLLGRAGDWGSGVADKARAEMAAGESANMANTAMLALGTGTAKAATALEFLASNALPALFAALAAFDAASQSVKDTQKARTDGLKQMADAKTVSQAIQGYDKAVSGGSFRVPLFGFHVPNLPGKVGNDIGGFTGSAFGDLGQEIVRIQAGERDFNQQRPLAERISAAERSGDYKTAFDLFRNDRSLQTQSPDFYNKTFNDLYTKMQHQAVGGKGGKDPFAEWEQAGEDVTNQLEPTLQTYSNRAKIFGTKGGDIQKLAYGYAYAVEHFGKAGKDGLPDPKAMQAITQAQSDLVSATDKQVQDLMNLATASGGDKQSAGYYEKALGAVKQTQDAIRRATAAANKLPGADVGKNNAAMNEALGLVAQKRQSAIQGLLGLMQSETDVNVSKIQGIGPEADLQRAEATLTGLQNQLSTARSKGADAQTINQLVSKVNTQQVTILQDKVNATQQLTQALTSMEQGQTADPVAQAQFAITNLKNEYQQLLSLGVHDKALLNALQGQIGSAELQQISAQISQEQAQSQMQLAQSNIGQPQQVQLQNAVNAAQQQLSYILSLPKSKVNPASIFSAYQNLYAAQGAMAQFQIQQGMEMIQAQTALKQAQTFDPVAIAEIALQGAKQLLSYMQAHHMPAAQIQQQAAQVAAAQKATLEAQWQKRESTIEFLASTYQITGATEIERLKKLYDSMKKAHASYTELQQVAKKIWDLEYGNTGNLNLNVGAMHLPSTYEVRSAILGGQAAAKRKTSAGLLADVKTNVNLTVNINRDADTHKVGDAIQRALGTTVNGLGQAMGLV